MTRVIIKTWAPRHSIKHKCVTHNIRRGMRIQLCVDNSVLDRIHDVILNRGDLEDDEDPAGPTIPTG